LEIFIGSHLRVSIVSPRSFSAKLSKFDERAALLKTLAKIKCNLPSPPFSSPFLFVALPNDEG